MQDPYGGGGNGGLYSSNGENKNGMPFIKHFIWIEK